MSEMERAVESYEAEIKELKRSISEMEIALSEERLTNKNLEREFNRLQGMVEAFEICVRARKI